MSIPLCSLFSFFYLIHLLMVPFPVSYSLSQSFFGCKFEGASVGHGRPFLADVLVTVIFISSALVLSLLPPLFTTTDVLLFLVEGLLAGRVLCIGIYLCLLAMCTHKIPLFFFIFHNLGCRGFPCYEGLIYDPFS
jgi:hypothetical protein